MFSIFHFSFSNLLRSSFSWLLNYTIFVNLYSLHNGDAQWPSRSVQFSEGGRTRCSISRRESQKGYCELLLCFYPIYFISCGLHFPLPELLVEYLFKIGFIFPNFASTFYLIRLSFDFRSSLQVRDLFRLGLCGKILFALVRFPSPLIPTGKSSQVCLRRLISGGLPFFFRIDGVLMASILTPLLSSWTKYISKTFFLPFLYCWPPFSVIGLNLARWKWWTHYKKTTVFAMSICGWLKSSQIGIVIAILIILVAESSQTHRKFAINLWWLCDYMENLRKHVAKLRLRLESQKLRRVFHEFDWWF